MALFAAKSFVLGAATGFILHQQMRPNLRIGSDEKIITVIYAVLAIVGATAALVQLTPSGQAGSFIGRAIVGSLPFVTSLFAGAAGYRLYAAVR